MYKYNKYIILPLSKPIAASLLIAKLSRERAICNNPGKWEAICDGQAVHILNNAPQAALPKPF